MKIKSVFLLGSFLIMTLWMSAQSVFPTDVGTKWQYVTLNYSNFGTWVGPFPAFTDEIVRDTTVNNVTYHKVARLSTSSEDCWYFRVYEDRVIYLDSIVNGLAFESTLFDYGLESGDSLSWKLHSIQDLGRKSPDHDYSGGQPLVLDEEITNAGTVLVPTGTGPHHLEFVPGVGQAVYEFQCAGANCPDPNLYLMRMSREGQVIYEQQFLTSREEDLAAGFQLEAYPNPCTDKLRINYELTQPEHVQLEVLNLEGRVVHQLLNERQAAGTYEMFLHPDQTPVKPGMYLLRLRAGEHEAVKKVLYLR